MCVKVFGFPEHVARHMFTLQSAYYIMTKIDKCTLCWEAADVEPDKAKKRSKMGRDAQILPIMNFGRGNRFPAYLTHRSGIDKSLLDLLRAMIPRGIREDFFGDSYITAWKAVYK
jgi:hypothetical protein